MGFVFIQIACQFGNLSKKLELKISEIQSFKEGVQYLVLSWIIYGY